MSGFALPFLLALPLIAAAFHRAGAGLRLSLTLGLASWAALAVVAAELGSLTGLLTPGAALVYWLAVCAGALVAVGLVWRGRAVRRERPSALEAAIAAAIAVIAGVTLFLALAHDPSTSDALTYRLPRLEHWIANGTLDHYPTNNERQVALPVLPEFLILQGRLLGGDHTWSGLMQWLSLLGSIAAVTLIVEHLGGGRRTQLLAGLLAASAPMAIAQASSTQSDLITAAFLLITVERMLAYMGGGGPGTALWAALAGGLALLAKGTAYLLGFPFALVFGLVALERERQRAVPLLLACGAIALLPNLGFYLRNLDGYGNPLGSHGSAVNNASFGPVQTADNLVRNVAMNLLVGVPGWDGAVVDATQSLRAATGIDAREADTTFSGFPFSVPRLAGFTRHEDFAPAPLHTLLVLLAFPLLLWRIGDPERRATLTYAACVLFGALLFSGVLRWQPWGTRLQLPLLLLAMPVVAMVAHRLRAAAPVAAVIALAATAQAAPHLLANTMKPLVDWSVDPADPSPAAGTMLANRPSQADSLAALGGFLRELDAPNIGLLLYLDEYELPLLLRLPAGARAEHVGVTNETARFPRPRGAFTPDVIVASRERGQPDPIRPGLPWIAAVNTAAFRVFVPLAVLEGRTGTFTFGAEMDVRALADGWSVPEPTGVWSTAPRATLYLRPPADATGTLRVRIQGIGFMGGAMTERVVKVSAGGGAPTDWRIPVGAPRQVLELTLPPGAWTPGDAVRIEFAFAERISPKSFGQADDRELGVFLERLDWSVE